MIGCAACFTQDAKDSIDTLNKTFNAGLLSLPITTRNGIYPTITLLKESPSSITLQKDQIAIYVGGGKDPIITTISEKITLGRIIENTIENSMQSDLIDLSPYDAYKCGVSRSHVTLVKKNGQLYVHDCGSVNGSWLDGQRMKPYELYSVNPGTMLCLGQLSVQVFFSGLSY
jgi:hypothetical protein